MIKLSKLKRVLIFGFCDSVAICLSLYLAFLIRLDFNPNHPFFRFFKISLPFFVILKLSIFPIFRLYNMAWRYVGLRDLLNIVRAVVFSNIILIIIIYFLKIKILMEFPRGVLVIDALFCIFLIASIRISKRLFLENTKIGRNKNNRKIRSVVLGGGNTGEMILRDMIKNEFNTYFPVGILDDDTNKTGTFVHGVKIIGKINDLSEIILKQKIDAILIAIPRLNHKILKEVHFLAKRSNVTEIKIVPRIYDYQHPQINLKSLEDISIEDLIGREPVEVEFDTIGKVLKGRRVLVSGGGGSIGSEVILQVCGFEPDHVVAFDIDETSLYYLEMKVKNKYPHLVKKIAYMVGDVRDINRVREAFEVYKPEIIYHAAAYKHVPMMEMNSGEAIKVNIVGTYNLVRIARENKVNKFTLISTDKAVNPTSIMGATKRIAEYICKAFNNEGLETRGEGQETEFLSVRFGNVLGSRGSVLPLFMDQLKEGGPLTVTHKDIERYFMTIPEAVSLVLQASVMGEGGDILVLDMGEPVKIVKLAEDLIKLHGFKPYEDIDIVFSGLRPGEKLFEELLTAEEGSFVTRHKKIFKAKISEDYPLSEIEKIVEEFKEKVYSNNSDEGEIRNMLKKYIKWYRGAINPEHRREDPKFKV